MEGELNWVKDCNWVEIIRQDSTKRRVWNTGRWLMLSVSKLPKPFTFNSLVYMCALKRRKYFQYGELSPFLPEKGSIFTSFKISGSGLSSASWGLLSSTKLRQNQGFCWRCCCPHLLAGKDRDACVRSTEPLYLSTHSHLNWCFQTRYSSSNLQCAVVFQ